MVQSYYYLRKDSMSKSDVIKQNVSELANFFISYCFATLQLPVSPGGPLTYNGATHAR